MSRIESENFGNIDVHVSISYSSVVVLVQIELLETSVGFIKTIRISLEMEIEVINVIEHKDIIEVVKMSP